MHGEDVRAVQQGLNEYFQGTRPRLDPDGVYGPHTRDAVNAFQTANPGTGKADGSPDGIVGSRTRRKLFPLAVVTVSAVGYRLTMPPWPGPRVGIRPPSLGPGPLQPPGTPQPPGIVPNPNANVLHVDWSQYLNLGRLDFSPQHFPGLRLPIATPPVPLPPRLVLDPTPLIPPAPSPGPILPFGVVHHFELSPGAQMMLANPSQTSFTLGLQGVAMIGDDAAAHQEFAMGIQAASPNVDGSGDWSFTWYAQITDVDRFGALGLFHWWQPYAQLGIQHVQNSFSPVITGNLFPVNLGFDVNKSLTISVAGGVALIYDPQTGAVTAGIQGTAGLILKFDGPAR